MKRLIFLVSIVLLSSCSASWHVRKARKLDPSLFTTKVIVETDTLVVEIPTILERVKIDTLVEIVQLDPITNTETIIKYMIKNDTIMIDCPDSEIITVVETKTEIIVIEPTMWEKLQFSLYFIALIVLIALVKWVRG